MAYGKLASKTDWLISIFPKKDLFYFIQQLLELGDHYSPNFKTLYDKLKPLFNESLESMLLKIKVDQEIKINLEEHFRKWKKTDQNLKKNLALELNAPGHGVYYTIQHHLQKQFDDIGFDEAFQNAVSSNEIGVHFINLFFSGKSEETWQKIQNLLKDAKIKEAAIQECQLKVVKRKFDEKEALDKVASPRIQEAFRNMKVNFIENPYYNDAVYTFVDVELLFAAKYPKYVDERFF